MDGLWFDALARSLGHASSRRGLLSVLAGSLAGRAALGATEVGAVCRKHTECKGVKICAHGRCVWPANFVGARCSRNGPECRNGSLCNTYYTGKQEGKCVCRREFGWQMCGASKRERRCVNAYADVANCGACDRVCPATTPICNAGNCCAPDGSTCPPGCGSGNVCSGCCSGECRIDGTCGRIVACIENTQPCPSGCAPDQPCPGCCEARCDEGSKCAPLGCALYGRACSDSLPCCQGIPCNGNRCVFT
jgi:hypothetical protein